VLAAYDSGDLSTTVGTEGGFKKWANALGKAQKRKGKRLFMPLRIALTVRHQLGYLQVTRQAPCTLAERLPCCHDDQSRWLESWCVHNKRPVMYAVACSCASTDTGRCCCTQKWDFQQGGEYFQCRTASSLLPWKFQDMLNLIGGFYSHKLGRF
jgi:hypothetical protein